MRRFGPSCIALLLCLAPALRASPWPSAIHRVEANLRSPEIELRRRAAHELADLPRQSALRLALVALDDADVEVRLAALDAAVQARAPNLGDRLVAWLTDPERRLRLASAEALASNPSPRAVAALGRAVGDADPAVRVAAAAALARAPSEATSIALLGHLDDSVVEVRVEVARALGVLGSSRAVVPLIGKIEDSRPVVREAVARALGELADPRSVSALLLTLRDSDENVRVAALDALARIGDPSAGAAVAGVLAEGAEGRVREAALEALARIGTPQTLEALVAELGPDEPGRPRQPVVEALARGGEVAAHLLTQCLASDSDLDHADGCALALAATGQKSASRAVSEALRRGALHPRAALEALAALGAREALPTVLEYLADDDLLIRKAAIQAASELLDPLHPDGRAVDPVAHALARVRDSRAERLALTALLGRTGSPRAAATLAALAGHDDDLELRVTAISALGQISDSGQSRVLLDALADDSGSVRLAAALSLFRVGAPGLGAVLLDRFESAAEQDRVALALALGGALAREPTRALGERVATLAEQSSASERDALIEAAGRMPGSAATSRIAGWAGASPDPADRGKLAEALAAHPAQREVLVRLLADSDARVRANAVWALGSAGDASDVERLSAAIGDREVSVAGNALGALARLAERAHVKLGQRLCAALLERRAYLRAAALRALRVSGERCPDGRELELLAKDASELVRASAAALVRDLRQGTQDDQALARAHSTDPSGRVLLESGAVPRALPDASEPSLVLVVSPDDDAPRPGAAFVLELADGLLRFGVADRRGAVYEAFAPRGRLALLPEPLALK